MQSSAVTRSDIINGLLESGLVSRCVKYQTKGCTDEWLKEELEEEIWLWLLTYNWESLLDAWQGRHINALISAFIRNQFHSQTSNFYRTHKRFGLISDDITEKELNIPDE